MTQVYYAYSEADARHRDPLERQLRNLKQRGVISDWHGRAVGRVNARGEVSPHAKDADVVLLLTSSDLVSSDYLHGPELNLALERHRKGEARVISVLLRPCNLKGTPFANLPSLPRDGKPVTRWSDTEAAFQAIAAGIAGPRAATTATTAATGDEGSEAQPAAPQANGTSAGTAGAASRPAATAPSGPAGPSSAEVALRPDEIGPDYTAVEQPGAAEAAQGAAQGDAGRKFVSQARAGSRRVAQLVYQANDTADAVARLESAVRSEVSRGAELDPAGSITFAGATMRRVRAAGKTLTSSMLAAKGRYLIAVKVIDPAGTESEQDAMAFAESLTSRLLARIPF